MILAPAQKIGTFWASRSLLHKPHYGNPRRNHVDEASRNRLHRETEGVIHAREHEKRLRDAYRNPHEQPKPLTLHRLLAREKHVKPPVDVGEAEAENPRVQEK